MNRTRTQSPFPNVLGVAGVSIDELKGRAAIKQLEAGRVGEVRTAEVLARHCAPAGPTVLHDLSIPLRGIGANIDHLVVSGRSVRILDSKLWRPSLYWTVSGRTFAGARAVPYADKETLKMAQTAITSYLNKTIGRGRYKIRRPLVVVWPSTSRRKLNLALYRPLAADATTGDRFRSRAGHFVGSRPADNDIVEALLPLLKNSPFASKFRADDFA